MLHEVAENGWHVSGASTFAVPAPITVGNAVPAFFRLGRSRRLGLDAGVEAGLGEEVGRKESRGRSGEGGRRGGAAV